MRHAVILPSLASILLLSGVASSAEPAPTPASGETADASAQPGDGGLAPLSETLTGEAKAEYAAARILYEDGDYQGALNKLEVAYGQSGDARLLWNMAAAEKNLRHYAKVMKLIERYLAAGAPYVTDADRQQAEELMTTMRGFVSSVTFTIRPEGASVSVDDELLGKSPFSAPVQLDFGDRVVRVSKPGYLPEELQLKLEGGSPASVAVNLVAEVHQGSLHVVTDPRTVIRIDGKVVASGMWSGVLPSGPHTVQLEEANKIPQSTEVVVQDGATRTLDIHLRDQASEAGAGVPTWLWITGGVAAAAALGAGGYFLFKKDETRPAPIDGTWYTLELR
jgi:hypothetical protein